MKKPEHKNNGSISSLFIENEDRKAINKFKEKAPEGSSKVWHQIKRTTKLPLYFLFDGLKVHRSITRFKIFENIGFFKGLINKIHHIKYQRKTKLKTHEEEIISNSIKEIGEESRIGIIKKAQGLAIFLIFVLISVPLGTIFLLEVNSIIVYINIGVSCFLLFLLIVARLKDAYLLKYTRFNINNLFSLQFWSFSSQLGKGL